MGRVEGDRPGSRLVELQSMLEVLKLPLNAVAPVVLLILGDMADMPLERFPRPPCSRAAAMTTGLLVEVARRFCWRISPLQIVDSVSDLVSQ